MISNNLLLRTSGVTFTGATGAGDQLEYMTNLGSSQTANSELVAVSPGTVVGLVIDPTTSLVDEMDFNQTIDSDMGRVISYRIVFSDYGPEAG